jgi:propionate CoA-transferase
MPDGVPSVIAEQGRLDEVTFTVEQGIIGGIPVRGVEFGVARNPEAIIAEDAQFTYYDGGNLDIAFLGFAQVDEEGNVNVSKVGPMLAGCGGFINISQNARKVVFCGTLTAKGTEVALEGGRITVRKEGRIRKFVSRVEQITFNGRYALERGQEVLYVTERGVFRLTGEGLELIEVAPGIDLESQLLDQMEFRPRLGENLGSMAAPSVGSGE